jgi:hypothetical protein
MIEGNLSPRLEPLVSVTVRNNLGSAVTAEAVVDTGFNDYFTVSAEMVATLNLEPVSSTLIELADGSVRETNYYPLYIEWMGVERFILAQDSDGPPLLGMMLLLNCELCITVRNDGPVTIKPAP